MADKIIVRIDKDLEDLIPGFFDRRAKDVESIKEAMVDDDFYTVRRLGHDMKGAGGGYGFDLITEIGTSLELAAMEQDRNAIEERLSELIDYVDKVVVEYI